MNRLFRRFLRNREQGRFLDRLKSRTKKSPSTLQLEPLENRVLLTTLILPEGATEDTVFTYADPNSGDPGDDDYDEFGEVRLSTLSGLPPEKDIVVELLDYEGNDIAGLYTEAGSGEIVEINGGYGGGPLIQEVPTDDVVGTLGFSVNALATASNGLTYGISNFGQLVRINAQDGTGTAIGPIVDAEDNPNTTQDIFFTSFYSATIVQNTNSEDVLYAVATGPAGFDALGNPLPINHPMLISVDLDTGEVDPVGRDENGLPNYPNSRVFLPTLGYDLTVETIVLNQEGGANPFPQTDAPEFLGFATWNPLDDEDEPDDDAVDRALVTINVADNPFTEDIQVVSTVLATLVDDNGQFDEDTILDGLAYDNTGRLFALSHTDGEKTRNTANWGDGQLVFVDILGGVANIPPVPSGEYGTYPIGDDDADVWLTGLTYSSILGKAFATDPNNLTLYEIGLDRIVGEGDDAVLRGLSDIYLVYVAESTADAMLTFTSFTIDPLTYHPAEGDETFLFTDITGSDIYTPSEAGGIAIGTIPRFGSDIIWGAGLIPPNYAGATGTFFDPNELGPMDYTAGIHNFKDMPAHGAYPGGPFRPGIVVAPNIDGPQDIGRIQVDGVVYGDVEINGGIDTFYAGFLGTNRFVVDGDMNNLLVHTYAGGIPESQNWWVEVNSMQYGGSGSGPSLDVHGELGTIYSNLEWGLPIRVHGENTAPNFAGMLDPDNMGYDPVHREIERKIVTNPSGQTFALGSFEIAGGYMFVNDSPHTAQYLGTVDGKINLAGMAEGTFDPEDFYSFGLKAGQTITITIYSSLGLSNPITGNPADTDSSLLLSEFGISGGIDLFDPEMNWVANNGEADKVTNTEKSLVYTAEEAGIYTLAVNGAFANSQILGFTYRLEIEGVSETVMGGANILGDTRRDILSDGYDIPLVHVVDGNLGAFNAGAVIRSSTFQVDEGDLIAIRGGGNALPIGSHIPQRLFTGEMVIPPAGEAGFGLEIPPNVIYSVLYVSGDVGGIRSPQISLIDIYIGGDLQSMRIGTELVTPEFTVGDDDDDDDAAGDGADFAGIVAVDGNIGEVRVSGNVDGVGIFANADGIGDPGVIDVIMIGGSLGTLTTPIVSVGDRGGNVRFADIRGNITYILGSVTTASLGDITFDAGQSVLITDDSGALIKISPGFTGVDDDELEVPPGLIGSFVPGEDDDDDDDDDDDEPTDEEIADEGGVLSLKLLPVMDVTADEWMIHGPYNKKELGYAILSIESTDGLRISSQGGPAEVGVVSADGINDDSVIIGGDYALSALTIIVPPPVTEDVDDEDTDVDEDDDDVIVIPDDPDTEEDESQIIQRVGISEVINNSGHYEHLFNGRWVPGKGQFTRWVGGDIISLLIGSPGAGRNVSSDGDETTVEVEEEVVQIYPFQVVRSRGHLGVTQNTTGQIIQSSILSPEDTTVEADPGGAQRVGLVSEVGIELITVAGAVGDIDVRDHVGRILVNADNSRFDGQNHGIAGPIIIYGNLTAIDVGDGLPAPGTGWEAKSGIFVYGSLGNVYATGEGHDLVGPIFAVTEIDTIQALNGADIGGYNRRIFSSERAEGSIVGGPTIYVGVEPSAFQLEETTFGTSGPVNNILVLGEGGKIDGATFFADSYNTILVNGGADGIFYSRILTSDFSTSDVGFIRQMLVGGQGIHNTAINIARELGRIVVMPGGDMVNSEIRGSYEMGMIIADNFTRTDIDATNKLDRVIAREGMLDLVIETGELGHLQAGDNILGSGIIVGGPVGRIFTRGDLISTIEVTGPHGNLNLLYAGGNLGTPSGGEIIVDGRIGTIKVGGDFDAGLLLNWEPGTDEIPTGYKKYERFGNELDKLFVNGSISSFGAIGGDVGMIMSGGDFGSPVEPLLIDGDLGKLVVGSGKAPSLLQSDLTVNGHVRQILSFGDINGDLAIEENFNTLFLKGMGDERANLNGDVTVGGDFSKLLILNGDRNGSLFVDGSGPKEIIKGSDITSTTIITGDNSVPNDGFNIDGSLKSGARYVSTIDTREIRIGGDIEAGAYLVIDGDLDRLIVEGDILGHVHVTGSIGMVQTGRIGDNSVTATVTAGGDIRQIVVDGDIEDSYVLAGFDPGFGDELILEEYEEEDLSAMFDPSRFTVDGTDADPRERALSGNIESVQAETLFNSVIAAGVSPGINATFGDSDGSDMPGEGLSRIHRVALADIRGKETGDGSSLPYGVFADSEIALLTVGRQRIQVPVLQSSGFRAWTLASISETGIGGFIFEQGRPYRDELTIDGETVPITITLSGDGIGQVLIRDDDSGIEAIQLENTTDRTTVKIVAAGRAMVDIDRLFNEDDADLNALIVDGIIGGSEEVNDLYIGGDVRKLMIEGIETGSRAVVGGDILVADLGELVGSDAETTMTVDGSINLFRAETIGDGVTFTADNIRQMVVDKDVDGRIVSLNDAIQAITIRNGIFKGAISSAGDINRITVKGRTVTLQDDDINPVYRNKDVSIYGGSIRAGGEIHSAVSSNIISLATIAAAEDFDRMFVRGNVEFSTIAAGLDIGRDADLYDLDTVTAGEGDLMTVRITGDLVQSNLVAGVAPGADKFFATDDDRLDPKNAEEIEPPRIIWVSFDADDSGQNLKTINVHFQKTAQGLSSDIGLIQIAGEVRGSNSPVDQYAIVAAGKIGAVRSENDTFRGVGNVVRQTINTKDILGSSIEANSLKTLEEALAAAFIIQTDGIDHEFEDLDTLRELAADGSLTEVDDAIVFGNDVWIDFDPVTNIASFHKDSGFDINIEGTNYFRIYLDHEQVVNRMGVPLDGQFTGEWPTGERGESGQYLPNQNGSTFSYYFAVSDVGDTELTAFSPFEGDFPTNTLWSYTSAIGDNPQLTGDDISADADFYLLKDVKQGQVLNMWLKDQSTNFPSWAYSGNINNLEVQIWRVQPSQALENQFVPLIEFNALDELAPPRDLLIPYISELAYSSDTVYGYDDLSQQFYTFDDDFNITILPNDVDELNNLPAIANDEGFISSLHGLTGHPGDSLWAIASYQTTTEPLRESLVLIENVSVEQGTNEDLEPRIFVSEVELTESITALAELDGVLYGFDDTNNQLVTFDSDPASATFGQIIENRSLVNSGIEAANLNITGLDVLHFDNPLTGEEDELLIALHDQSLGEDQYDNLLVDSLFTIEPVTNNEAVLELWQELDANELYSGLTLIPQGQGFIGTPIWGTPRGDEVDITFNNETSSIEFGSSDTVEFRGSQFITVTSDPDYVDTDEDYTLLENLEQQEFIDGGFYYAFNISYLTGGFNEFTIEISDIDWFDSVLGQSNDLAGIDSFFSDDPDAVNLQVLQQLDPFTLEVEESLFITISPLDGDGDVKVFFGTTGMLHQFNNVDVNPIGEIVGHNTRDDFEVARDMLMPGLEELTVAPLTLYTQQIIQDLPANIEDALTDYPELVELLDGEVSDDLISQVITIITNDFEPPLETELLFEFFASIETINYNALGYDADQEIFALISTTSYSALPIMVPDPFDPTEQVPMTLTTFSELYNQINPFVTITGLRGLEFGEVQQSLAPDEPSTVELWAIAEYAYESNSTLVNQESLIRFGNILNPFTQLRLSQFDLASVGYDQVNELAYGYADEDDPDNRKLYGLDVGTQTLLELESRLFLSDFEENTNFGRATPVGGSNAVGNLNTFGTATYNITGMDFNRDGRLLALEGDHNYILEISTNPHMGQGRNRVSLVQELPDDEAYETIAFIPNDLDFFAGQSDAVLTTGFLVRSVTGSPLDDADGIDITVSADNQEIAAGNHLLSSILSTPINYDGSFISLDTETGNTPVEVAAAGGYYHIELSYSTNQGVIQVSFDDIEWAGGNGGIDSVIVSDNLNVTVLDFDENTFTLQIDTLNRNGVVDIYFGATADIFEPTTDNYSLEFVNSHMSLLDDIQFSQQLPEDGDYFVRIADWLNSSPELNDLFDLTLTETVSKYKMNLMVFDDGNSDFGVSDGNTTYLTENGYLYDPLVPHNTPISLTPDRNTDGTYDEFPDEFSPDPNPKKEGLYHIRDPKWPSHARGQFPAPGASAQIIIDSQLGCAADSDVYMAQLQEGQRITVNIDADILFGNDEFEVIVGVYNADLEAIATVYTDGNDFPELTDTASDDPAYTAQAVFTLPNHDGQIDPDPDNDGIGTYYIVVSGIHYLSPYFALPINQPIPYRLTVETEAAWNKNSTDKEEVERVREDLDELGLNLDDINDNGVILPKSQLVWLSFGDIITGRNTAADFLAEVHGMNPDVAVPRPAFSAADFGLDEFEWRDEVIQAVYERVTEVYSNVGLAAYTEEKFAALSPAEQADAEMVFTVIRPGSVGSMFAGDAVYSTIILGGQLELGVTGLAETVDRFNRDRSDDCVVMTQTQGEFFSNLFTSEPNTQERFNESVNLIANTAAHELGHILGLEHARQVQVQEPNNLMNYYWLQYGEAHLKFVEQEFHDHNSFDEFAERHYGINLRLLGFSNEIDQLLRTIGSQSPIGA